MRNIFLTKNYQIINVTIILIVFVTIICGWIYIITQWIEASNTNDNSIGDLSVIAHPAQTSYSEEARATVELVNFNSITGETNFLLSFSAPLSLPNNYSNVIYKKLIIRYPGPNKFIEQTDISGDQFIGGEIERSIQTFRILSLPEIVIPSQILSNYPIEVYAIPNGYYPFQQYKLSIYMWLQGEYLDTNGESTILIRPIETIYFDNMQSYPIRIETSTGVEKIDSLLELTPIEEGGFIKVIFREPIFATVFIPMLFIMITVISLSTFLVHDISNVIQIIVAIMFSIWGVTNIILPDFSNKSLLFGIEQSILLLYFTLGIITISRVALTFLEIKRLKNIKSSKDNFIDQNKNNTKSKAKTKEKKPNTRKKKL